MKRTACVFVFILISVFVISCADTNKAKEKPAVTTDVKKVKKVQKVKKIAKITEETFDRRNDSIIFISATIENFDVDGNSIDVFWLNEKRDTILRLYRKYDENKKLIGAEYYEEGDTKPSRDTVYINSEGKKVEASLNAEGKISWKSTITTDTKGNPVLKTYTNGKGEYRGYDSLYFNQQNREIKGFYENSKGKRSNFRTYTYTARDKQGNWVRRVVFINDTVTQSQRRFLKYHK
ncbi:MAG: hypothetical protein AAF617_02245 [Bacteroidota bacterium]